MKYLEQKTLGDILQEKNAVIKIQQEKRMEIYLIILFFILKVKIIHGIEQLILGPMKKY